MSSTEFIVLGGMVIAGLLFFLMTQTFVFEWGTWTQEYIYKSEAKGIVSLIERVSKEPNELVYYSYNISLSNITVKSGILTYEKNGLSYSFHVPENVNDVVMPEVSSICIEKSGDEIIINQTCPECNMDSFCTPNECDSNCPDCYGPDPACIGDGACNKDIGENCLNSVDCSCKQGICCPSSPDSDENGCSKISGLDKGEECFCDNQCTSNLECNPTTKGFTAYKKACCEKGKNWDGSKCVQPVCTYPCSSGCKLPEKWDWRNVNGINYLNPVRNQAHCGSCWAFSAIGAIEGTYNVENNCPACNKDLSEQILVSNSNPCCGFCGSCNGGWPHKALSYASSNGVCDESCYPYVAGNVGLRPYLPCNICADYLTKLWKINSFGRVVSDFDAIKRAIICYGPLSIASMNWRHAIVLVGYDDTKQRWIIRNSWGSGWGDSGYGYIPYSGHQYSDLKNYVYYIKGVISP